MALKNKHSTTFTAYVFFILISGMIGKAFGASFDQHASIISNEPDHRHLPGTSFSFTAEGGQVGEANKNQLRKVSTFGETIRQQQCGCCYLHMEESNRATKLVSIERKWVFGILQSAFVTNRRTFFCREWTGICLGGFAFPFAPMKVELIQHLSDAGARWTEPDLWFSLLKGFDWRV